MPKKKSEGASEQNKYQLADKEIQPLLKQIFDNNIKND